MSDIQQEDNINISVIIPHYNDVKGLFRLVKSIPIDNDIEIIIVDDYSDDDVYEDIIKLYQKWKMERNIAVYQNEGVKSAGSCRNIGMDSARGKWILFADADDYFTQNAFDIIEKHFGSKHDVVYFGVTSIYEESGEESSRHIVTKKEVDSFCSNPGRKEELLLRMSVPPWAKLIKRDFLEQNKIRSEEIRYSNDVMLSTKIGCLARSIDADSRVVYCITDKKGTLTKIKNCDSSGIRNRAFLRRYIYWYQHIPKRDMKLAGMRLYGIRSILNPVKNNKDWKSAKENINLLIREKVPIIF